MSEEEAFQRSRFFVVLIGKNLAGDMEYGVVEREGMVDGCEFRLLMMAFDGEFCGQLAETLNGEFPNEAMEARAEGLFGCFLMLNAMGEPRYGLLARVGGSVPVRFAMIKRGMNKQTMARLLSIGNGRAKAINLSNAEGVEG